MNDYMPVKEAAKKWGTSERRVQILCRQNRLAGVLRFGHSWVIPKDAEKPPDNRYKKNEFGPRL